MSSLVFAACLIAVLIWMPSASAASITNRDDTDHKVTVVEEKAKQDNVLKPSAVIEGVCQKGCVVRLNDNELDEYKLDGSDIVSIEDGYLYYDGPVTGEVPKVGDADQRTDPSAE